MESIEDIILGNDQRGVAALQPYLSQDYCARAAEFVLSEEGTVIIATGFYILAGDASETDGPPGALAIGRALEDLGHPVVYVSDRYTVPILGALVEDNSQIVEFPITDDEESRRYASELLAKLHPSLLISIERCGLTREGTYLNMRGIDISPYTARIDHLFLQHSRTVGIGDGGNEIGMGKLVQHIPQVATLPDKPATTGANHLVISSTSNWGGYGLVAAISRIVGRDLLPGVEEEEALIRRMVDMGAVDGFTGENRYSVDGKTIEEHGQVLTMLHGLLAGEGVSA